MTTYVVVDDHPIDPQLAVASVQDFLGDEGLATVIVKSSAEWGTALTEALGLDVADFPSAGFSHLDTVIGPPVEELVAEVTGSGATYLDISGGLVPLEVTSSDEVNESPDLENLPEPKEEPKKKRELPKPPPPAKKQAPAKKKKEQPEVTMAPQEQAPVAKISHYQEKKTLRVAEEQPKDKNLERTALILLVSALLEGASEDTLWSVAGTLREARTS